MRQLPTDKRFVNKRALDRINHLRNTLNRKHGQFADVNTKIGSFLDLGCGNAEITFDIAQTLHIPHVYGADVYPRNDYKQPNSESNIIYKQVIDNSIDLPDNSIDLVTCFMTIHHFENFDKMMSEICRILKPNGWFFFREHDVHHLNMDLKQFLDEKHLEYPDHPGGTINYWERCQLRNELEDKYNFKHYGDSDYPKNVKNVQAIYHSVYLYAPNGGLKSQS